MTAFFLLGAALILVTVVLVTRPLWRATPWVGASVGAALALSSALLYGVVGTPAALDPSRRAAPETLGDAVAQLAAELERNPDQPEGWRILARAHANQGRYAEAGAAYAQALQRAPDAEVYVEAAETRAQGAPQRRFDAEGVRMLERALKLQPAHQRARWFLGIAQRQAGRPADAAATWEPLLAAVDAKTSASLVQQIDAARAEAGLPALARAPLEKPGAQADALDVRIELSPAMASRVPPGASLFVIARAPGTVMPVAAKRLPASGFPLSVTLGDADSPMPTRRLSELERAEVFVRVSASGEASARPGDLVSDAVTIERGHAGAVRLVIDRALD